jgi:hypothetical protein
MESNTWCPRLTAWIILSGSAVHVKGFGFALCSMTKRLIAACKSTTDRTCLCGVLRSRASAFRRRRSPGLRVMEIPVRMRQTRMHSASGESPSGFKCQTRSTRTRSKIFKTAPQISLTEQQWLKRVDDARPDRGIRCECAYADCRSCAIGRRKLKLRTNGLIRLQPSTRRHCCNQPGIRCVRRPRQRRASAWRLLARPVRSIHRRRAYTEPNLRSIAALHKNSAACSITWG